MHHYVHEGGWTITGNSNGKLAFTPPTGTMLRTTQAAA